MEGTTVYQGKVYVGMEKLFFDFLQVAVGNKKSLSVSISDTDWLRLFEFCQKQALVGVGFSAVEKLHDVGVVCPTNLRMQWMSLALQIEKQNEKLNRQCTEITRLYNHDGLDTCILKGQGNLLYYPEHLSKRRQSGDIDVWAVCKNDISIAVQTGRDSVEYITYHGIKAVVQYVKQLYRLEGKEDSSIISYHHIDAPDMSGTPIEVHFLPAHLYSPFRNRRLQKWFECHEDECMKNKTHLGFAIPTSSVNVIYQMTHIFKHNIDGGLGFRHLMDYYYALRVWHNDVMECKDLQSQGMWSEGLGTPVMSKEEVMAVLRSFGMAKFTAAVMWVLNEVFVGEHENENSERQQEQHKTTWCPQADGRSEHELSRIDRELKENNYVPWMICEPNEKEGKKLLAEIMQGGNFGQYDTRDAALKKGGMMKHGLWKLKRVMRLVSSYPEEALWEPVFRVYHWGVEINSLIGNIDHV